MSHSPDIWLTPAQAVYFFVTGDNLVEVTRLSHDVVIGTLARIPNAFVPLSADAGPEERAAALKEIRERLGAAGESQCAAAIKWRDHLLATGLVAAEGRRTPSSPYETIKPVEFCDLRLAGPHAENARREMVFYDVRISGWDLSRARQRAMASDVTPVAIQAGKASANQPLPHVLSERFNNPASDLRDARGAAQSHAAPEADFRNLVEEVQRRERWRRQRWRREWIAKFAERQRVTRRWVAIPDIADWCAQSTTGASIEEEEKARELAFRRLADSMLRGEFDGDGRSKILYLDPSVSGDGASPRCRLTTEQFEIAFNSAAIPPAPSLPLLVLGGCWLPRRLARRWLEAHGYRWAPHFEPSSKKLTPAPIQLAGSQSATVPGPQTSEPMASTSGIRTTRAARAEDACRDRIARLRERPANKDEAFANAQTAVAPIGSLSRKAFHRAWAAAAPAQWLRAGRRRKHL